MMSSFKANLPKKAPTNDESSIFTLKKIYVVDDMDEKRKRLLKEICSTPEVLIEVGASIQKADDAVAKATKRNGGEGKKIMSTKECVSFSSSTVILTLFLLYLEMTWQMVLRGDDSSDILFEGEHESKRQKILDNGKVLELKLSPTASTMKQYVLDLQRHFKALFETIAYHGFLIVVGHRGIQDRMQMTARALIFLSACLGASFDESLHWKMNYDRVAFPANLARGKSIREAIDVLPDKFGKKFSSCGCRMNREVHHGQGVGSGKHPYFNMHEKLRSNYARLLAEVKTFNSERDFKPTPRDLLLEISLYYGVLTKAIAYHNDELKVREMPEECIDEAVEGVAGIGVAMLNLCVLYEVYMPTMQPLLEDKPFDKFEDKPFDKFEYKPFDKSEEAADGKADEDEIESIGSEEY